MKHTKNGFSLVEMMVALMVLMGAMVLISQQASKVRKSIAALAVSSELASLKDYVIQATSCGDTLRQYRTAAGTIACSGAIPLIDQAGAVIPLSTPAWDLQVDCSNTDLTVKVQLKNGGATRTHPLTGDPLSFANTSINPLVGRGSSVGLCAASFSSFSRAKVYTPTLAAIGGFTPWNCNTVKTAPAWPASGINDTNGYNNYSAPYWLAFRMHDGCANFCKLPSQNAKGGYLVDCTAARATCVCFR